MWMWLLPVSVAASGSCLTSRKHPCMAVHVQESQQLRLCAACGLNCFAVCEHLCPVSVPARQGRCRQCRAVRCYQCAGHCMY